ncbi:MAG: type II toxin-antitoxin system PemK/MazF family toxin [Erysipelotrichaceae bacterium]|nr:type II toxin-antitoxin system PemK/MazF family toxin [Erysipelotrichaceae bacterium]
MKRGEIWTLQDKNYASKARPVVVIQSDKHNTFDSVILCLFTSFESDDTGTRVCVEPTAENGLQKVSYVMADKIVTVDKNMLGRRIGILSKKDMTAVSKQLKIILDL